MHKIHSLTIMTRFLLTSLFLFFQLTNVYAIDIWSVGTKDFSNAEFLSLNLEPETYAPFAEKGFSITLLKDQTTVDPKLYPNTLPGPRDVWAGSKSYFVTITFDLPPTIDLKGTELFLELHGKAQHPLPPVLEIVLNDSQQLLQTTSGVGEPWSSYKIPFASDFLKPTGNTLRITNTKGSWFQFDALRFIVLQGKVETIHLTPLPGILRGTDGIPMRRIHIDFNGETLKVPATLQMKSSAASATLTYYTKDVSEIEANVPVDRQSPEKEQKLIVTLQQQDLMPITTETVLPSERQWIIHLVHQTHLDIGYTHIQTDILKRQVQSLRDALKYINETKDYPEEAKFRFHPEGMWAVEAFFKEATEEEKAAFIKAARNRDLHIDGMYAQAMTGMYNDEELFELFGSAARFCREHDIVLDSVMQTDLPGYTWGLVPTMYQCGIRYMTMGPNPGHRIGRVYEPWGDKPFWWVSPSGKEKILCWLLDTGYHQFHGKPLGHVLSEEEVFRILAGDDWIKRDREGKRTFLFDDLVVIRYGIEGDNGRPNRVLSDTVKAWNEKFLYPKLVISRNSDVMRFLETQYGDQLPVLRGDYTPYWEDGSASTSEATAINRRTCEKISQAQILWSMLNPTKKLFSDFDVAWTDLIMYDEHTWGAHNSIVEPDSDFVKTQDAFKQEYAKRGSREVEAILDKIIEESPILKKGTKNDMVLINTTNRDSRGICFIGKSQTKDWNLAMYKNDIGNILPVQGVVDPNESETCSLYANFSYEENVVPALGMVSLILDKKTEIPRIPSALYIDAETGEMGNDRMQLVIDKQSGAIKSLKLNSINHEFVDVGADGNRGLNDYLYIIGRNAEENRSRNEGTVKLTVVASGPLVASMLIETDSASTPNAESFKRQITIFADSEKIRIENVLDKKMERNPEGTFFGFPFNIPNGKWFLDMPWALVEVDKDQLPGANRNFYPLQRYAVYAGEKIGINWITVDSNMMQFAPIRLTGPHGPLSAWRKEFQPGGTLYSWVCNNHWETNYKAGQDGQLCFEYWIWPYVASFDNSVAQRFARQVHQPLLRIDGVTAAHPKMHLPPVLATNKDIVITSIKPTRDGNGALSVRLFNPTSEQLTTKLRLPLPHQKIYRSNPLEDQLEKLDEIVFAPWEIVTVRVK